MGSAQEAIRYYQIKTLVHLPSPEHDDLYLVEAPELSGCCAWGSTLDEARENLKSVAEEFLATYRKQGIPIPLTPIASEAAPLVVHA